MGDGTQAEGGDYSPYLIKQKPTGCYVFPLIEKYWIITSLHN